MPKQALRKCQETAIRLQEHSVDGHASRQRLIASCVATQNHLQAKNDFTPLEDSGIVLTSILSEDTRRVFNVKGNLT